MPAALVPLSYVRSVAAAGGRPLAIPPLDDGVEETLDTLDALVLSGGSDLDPELYGAEPHPATSGVRPERDRAELALLREALERDLPLLAICRGSQLLNVVHGGDLVQHVPEVVGHDGHKETPGVFSEHEIETAPTSRLRELLGGRTLVKSHHHQAYGRLGRGLVEAAWAEDGTLEAIEDPSRRFAVGVQWHPEEGGGAALFRALVEEARRYRAERGAALP